MRISPIEQYCLAIEEWAEITRCDAGELVFWSMVHSGGVRHVHPEGGVDNPWAPEHRGKTYGEVSGKYTIEQLRAHLKYLADQVYIPESTLICGLVSAVERQLKGYVTGYKDGIDRRQQLAEEFQRYYEHTDDYPEMLELMNKDRRERNREPFKREDFLRLANVFWRSCQASENEEAQRKSWLAAWNRVTAPITEYDNLDEWFSEYIQAVTGWMAE